MMVVADTQVDRGSAPGVQLGSLADDPRLPAQILIPENFSGEGLYESLLPSVQRQAGFATGLFEENNAIPVMFDWHLGQKQATASTQADHQAMPAHLHIFRTGRPHGGEDA